MKKYLITGCAGFIGSNFVYYMLKKYSDILLVNLDKLTYAGNLENLKGIEGDSRHIFVQGDICDKELVASLFEKYMLWNEDYKSVINVKKPRTALDRKKYDIKAEYYPEEFNRQAVSIVSQYNFAPTKLSADNLIKEGRNPENIYITGNTVIDAMQHTVTEDYTHPELDWVGDDKLIFITAHRRENLGQPMHNMFRAIRRVLDEHSDCKAVYPIHMNPIVRKAAEEELGGCDRIHIIEPIEVFDCHNFESRCFMCLTDSGGIQEEVPSYGKPVLVMRDTTERPEGVTAGTLKLVGTDEDTIYSNFKLLLENREEYQKMANACNPYGDGHACKRIADILELGTYEPWKAE